MVPHSPIFAKFVRSKMRTWKSLIVQAFPWYVDPCSCGLDLQELQKIFCPWTKGGTSVKSFFHCGPPCDSKFENFCSSWRSRPLEHESTHHMEAQTMKLFHVLIFDLINFAKIGLCLFLKERRALRIHNSLEQRQIQSARLFAGLNFCYNAL